MMHPIQKWSDVADAKLQDCFASIDWNMFQDSSYGIEEYTTSVTAFINKYIDNVVPTVTLRTYPNQKPWITGNIHIELKARAAAFKERDTNLDAYKKLLLCPPMNHQTVKASIQDRILLHRLRRSSDVTGLENYGL